MILFCAIDFTGEEKNETGIDNDSLSSTKNQEEELKQESTDNLIFANKHHESEKEPQIVEELFENKENSQGILNDSQENILLNNEEDTTEKIEGFETLEGISHNDNVNQESQAYDINLEQAKDLEEVLNDSQENLIVNNEEENQQDEFNQKEKVIETSNKEKASLEQKVSDDKTVKDDEKVHKEKKAKQKKLEIHLLVHIVFVGFIVCFLLSCLPPFFLLVICPHLPNNFLKSEFEKTTETLEDMPSTIGDIEIKNRELGKDITEAIKEISTKRVKSFYFGLIIGFLLTISLSLCYHSLVELKDKVNDGEEGFDKIKEATSSLKAQFIIFILLCFVRSLFVKDFKILILSIILALYCSFSFIEQVNERFESLPESESSNL